MRLRIKQYVECYKYPLSFISKEVSDDVETVSAQTIRQWVNRDSPVEIIFNPIHPKMIYDLYFKKRRVGRFKKKTNVNKEKS